MFSRGPCYYLVTIFSMLSLLLTEEKGFKKNIGGLLKVESLMDRNEI